MSIQKNKKIKTNLSENLEKSVKADVYKKQNTVDKLIDRDYNNNR